MRFIKALGIVSGMVFAIALIAAIQPGLAVLAAVLLFLVSLVALVKPLPKIGLGSRGISAVALLIAVGCFGGTMDIWVKQVTQGATQQSAAIGQTNTPGTTTAASGEPTSQIQGSQQSASPASTDNVAETVDPKKAAMIAKTHGMTESIVTTIRQYYEIEPQPLIPNDPLCRDDGYCDFTAGLMRIQVYGAGLAIVETTDQVSRTDYLEMCSVVFAAISGANIVFAGETVGLAYGQALGAGSVKRDVSGVEINITPGLGDILGCRFFKY